MPATCLGSVCLSWANASLHRPDAVSHPSNPPTAMEPTVQFFDRFMPNSEMKELCKNGPGANHGQCVDVMSVYFVNAKLIFSIAPVNANGAL